jgi:hypothetical protein
VNRLALLACLVLAGCLSAPSPMKVLYALDGTYAGAATAEANYAHSSLADPAIVSTMKDYDNKAYIALAPLTAAAASGEGVDGVALAGAELAVSQFAAYITAHQVKP